MICKGPCNYIPDFYIAPLSTVSGISSLFPCSARGVRTYPGQPQARSRAHAHTFFLTQRPQPVLQSLTSVPRQESLIYQSISFICVITYLLHQFVFACPHVGPI